MVCITYDRPSGMYFFRDNQGIRRGIKKLTECFYSELSVFNTSFEQERHYYPKREILLYDKEISTLDEFKIKYPEYFLWTILIK